MAKKAEAAEVVEEGAEEDWVDAEDEAIGLDPLEAVD